jgi:hypothetical protein
LAWKGEARGQGGRRRGLRQFGQEPRADRVKRGGGGLRRLYDLDIQHEIIRALTNKVVNRKTAAGASLEGYDIVRLV